MGTLQGGGQVWKECRPWILSFLGLNPGSVCCGCVILGKLSDCSVPPQETLYSLQVCESSQHSQRQSQAPCVSLDWSCHYYFRAFKQGPSDLPCYQTRRHPGWAPSCLCERSDGKETGLETGVSKARHVCAGPSRLVSPHCLGIVRDTAVSLAPAHQISEALPFLDVQTADVPWSG